MTILLFFCISFFTLVSTLAPQNSYFKNKYTSHALIAVLISSLLILMPLINVHRSDMPVYLSAFNTISSYNFSSIFEGFYDWEPLFLIFQWIISRFTQNPLIYISIIYLLCASVLYKSIRNIYKGWQQIYVLFIYFCFPFFYDYTFNVLRHGIAIVFLTLAYTFWENKRHSVKFYTSLIVASLFHYSAIPFSILMMIVLSSKAGIKRYLILWFLAALSFVTNLNTYLLNLGFVSKIDAFNTYTNNSLISHYGSINRTDFLLFSAFFLLLSLYLLKKIKLSSKHESTYTNIIKLYIAFNTLFLLFGFIAYSDRIVIYSWFIIPILVSYPILHNYKKSNLLLFTLILISGCIGFFTSPIGDIFILQ